MDVHRVACEALHPKGLDIYSPCKEFYSFDSTIKTNRTHHLIFLFLKVLCNGHVPLYSLTETVNKVMVKGGRVEDCRAAACVF